MHHEASFMEGMVRSGAKGYILKNSSEILKKAIMTVGKGRTWFDEEVKEGLLQSLMPDHPLPLHSEYQTFPSGKGNSAAHHSGIYYP